MDFHLHVWPHQPGTPVPTLDQLEQYCEVAAATGVEQIAITEHGFRFVRVAEVLPHWDRPSEGPLADATRHVLEVERGGDLDAYVAVLVAAKERGPSDPG